MDILLAEMRQLDMPADVIRQIRELHTFLSPTHAKTVAALVAHAFVRGRLVEVDQRLMSLPKGEDHAFYN